VHNRLERWESDDVNDALLAADVVLQQRAELETIEGIVGIDEPDRAGVAYADAPMRPTGGVDFTEAQTVLDDAIARGGQLEERLEEVAVIAEQVGVDPPALSTLDDVDDFTSGLAAAEGLLLAMDRIVEVERQLDAATGFVTRIGRWGSDIELDLDRARTQVEAGDSDAALATLESAEREIDDLTAAGAVRLGIAGALLVLALVALVLVQRHRRTARSGRGDRGEALGAT
jgi:hypothetical protein